MGLRQNGLVLPLTLVIAMIAAALGFAVFKISRQQVISAGFYSDKERAYHLAIGGLNAGRTFLDNGLKFINAGDPDTFPKLDKAPKELKSLTNWLLNQLNDPTSAGEEFIFNPPEIQKLIDSQSGSKIKLSLVLNSPKSIYSGTNSGFKVDQREVLFRIILTVEANINRAGVKVQSFSVIHWASVLPSVLGKFVLMLKQPDQLNLNPIKDSNKNLKTAPINIISGSSPVISQKWNPTQARDEIDRRGWIFLGSSAQLNFGCSAAGGLKEFSEPLDNQGYFFNLETASTLDNSQTYEYFTVKRPIYSEINDDEETRELLTNLDQQEYSYSSSLNLFGSIKEPSPTFVIGNVLRRIILLQGIYHKSEGDSYPMPYLDQETFYRAKEGPDMTGGWPGINDRNLITILYNHFEHIAKADGATGFEKYKDRASQVISYPMNEINLEYIELPKGISNSPFPKLQSGLAENPPELQRLKSMGSQVAFHQPLLSGVLTIKNDHGMPVFENADLANISDLDFFKQKARHFDDQSSFYQALNRNSKLSIGGVAYIKGNLHIDKPIFVDTGGSGMILVQSDIKISSEIIKTDGETLTLISLGGNISVESSKKIQAGLIAMQGKVVLPYGVDIHGFIASKNLKIDSGFTVVKRRLEWDSLFDITDYQNYQRSFKASITSNWNFYVSGV